MQNKKNYLKLFSLLIMLSLIAIIACSSKKKQVVAEVGDEKIYLDDYETQYMKTVNNIDSAKNSNMEKRTEYIGRTAPGFGKERKFSDLLSDRQRYSRADDQRSL